MSRETLTTVSPNTGQPILTRQGLTLEELEQLPVTANAAYRSFSASTTLAQRRAIVGRALELLGNRKDELARELTEQMGRPISYGAGEVSTAIMRGHYLMRVSESALQDTQGDAESGFRRYIKKVPVGVVLIIFAWNYPYLILVNSLVAAILAGNAVIVKPSPQTPTVVENFCSAFVEAGLPKDVIQYFHCGQYSYLETLVRNPLINHISFTGSVSAGVDLKKAAAGRVVNVGLELGGNDPAYVREDADLAWAAEEVTDGAVFNSGQSCCSIERIYVHENIHDAFIREVQKVLSKYVLGDPFDTKTHVGPVISARAKENILQSIKDAIDKGAQDQTPPNQTFDNLPSAGNFVKLTLLTGMTEDMKIMQEETFGPVIPVMKVKDDEDAIQKMNKSNLGLTASVWTKDVDGAERDLLPRIEAGTVYINRSDYPSADLAWTGHKDSGIGVTLSPYGFDQFVKLKSFHIKQHPKQ